MTMPHLSNCPHSGDGWCLTCVSKLQFGKTALRTACETVIDELNKAPYMTAYCQRAYDAAKAAVELTNL